jgi:hypothetical protein
MRPLTLLAVWLLAANAMAAEPSRMRVDPSWPKPLPHGWVLGEVSGVAVDAADDVWIIQRPGGVTSDPTHIAAPPVIAFDPAGTVLRAWGGPGKGYDWVQNEHGITVDPKGFVWIGGNGAADGQVLKFT